jgi:hypothetical protein
MNWEQLLALIGELAGFSGLRVEDCAACLNCQFELVQARRYRATLELPFTKADLQISRDGSILVLDLSPAADTDSYLAALKSLGGPKDIQIVSPPLANPAQPKARPVWDYKFAYCYAIKTRKVWLGIEKLGETERLVSISVHSTENK